MEEKEKDIVEKQISNNDASCGTQEKKNDKKILFTILKKHKIGIAIIVLMLTVSSTLAWFTYSSAVDFSMTAHIKAWSVELDAKYDDVYEFNLSDMYPGMDVSTETVNIKNSGEVDASIGININSLTLFGEVQEYGVDYVIERSADGKEYIVRGYPFELKFILSGTEIAADSNARQSLSYELSWNYDNTNSESCIVNANGGVECSQCFTDADGVNSCDLEDTLLGEASATFRSDPANADTDSLVMSLSLSFSQVN